MPGTRPGAEAGSARVGEAITAGDPAPHAPGATRLWRHPGLIGFLLSRSLSAVAFQVQAVAIGWQAYATTRSPWTLGLIGLAQFLPMLGLVFVAGQVADRFDRRRIATLCQLVEACCGVALLLASRHHAVSPFFIYGLMAVFGAAKAFEGPSLQALLPSLVPPALFSRAAALSSSLFQTATIVGPSLGGLLIMAGARAAYGSCATLFVLAALGMCLVRLEQPVRPRGPVTLATVFGGIGFIRSRPAMLGAISLDLFAVLLGGATALLPVYALDILHGSPFWLGVLRASPAIGALAVSLVLARWPLRRRAGRSMFAAVAVFGVATIVFGLSRSLPLSILAMMVLGGADVVSVVVRSTLVQLNTPDEMRGRVSAVNLLFIVTSNQFGEFESGTVAGLIGTPASVVAGGIGTLLVTVLWMRMFPTLRRLDRLEDRPD
ncbi:MFS transporter [Rhizosaccharibacter radicis]|uniref:MFS transporter n=1 Tax=Rhizosaccharibacter radicis TaxID=2782605 RepID=A0ABT1W049_9PROT|nr:MFS transporter [Acetobacteraceae bacterium KSS12]